MRSFVTLACAAALVFALAPDASAQAYPSSDTPIAVPDGNPGGNVCGDPGAPAVSTITVPGGGGNVTDLNVILDISATWVGDVRVTLSNGTHTAVLVDHPGTTSPTGCGDSSNDFPGVIMDDEGTDGAIEDAGGAGTNDPAYTAGGRYTPNEPLSVFDGDPLEGTWTLTVFDGGEGDATTLNGWQLLFNDSPPVASEPGALPVGYAFDLLGANPFTSRTEFDLQVGVSQDVVVVVYDALGREAGTLYQGPVTAGRSHVVTFESGRLRAGTYIVRATGTDFDVVQPVTIVR